MVYKVDNVDTIDKVCSIKAALQCLNSSMFSVYLYTLYCRKGYAVIRDGTERMGHTPKTAKTNGAPVVLTIYSILAFEGKQRLDLYVLKCRKRWKEMFEVGKISWTPWKHLQQVKSQLQTLCAHLLLLTLDISFVLRFTPFS